eukprot:jgi/Astpho2/9875/fgenesh1_pm.00152_%23_1_t
MGRQELMLTYDGVRDKNLEQLKTLSRAIFPVRYQDKVYQEIINAKEFSRLAYHNDVLVGAIGCRLEASEEGSKRLYIILLGVLAPYRGMLTGTRLLEKSLHECSKDSSIKEVYLHVQSNNEDAVQFYKRNGFAVGDTIKGYYKRLTPSDAIVLSRKLDQL